MLVGAELSCEKRKATVLPPATAETDIAGSPDRGNPWAESRETPCVPPIWEGCTPLRVSCRGARGFPGPRTILTYAWQGCDVVCDSSRKSNF